MNYGAALNTEANHNILGNSLILGNSKNIRSNSTKIEPPKVSNLIGWG
jgi:hypothetical protein